MGGGAAEEAEQARTRRPLSDAVAEASSDHPRGVPRDDGGLRGRRPVGAEELRERTHRQNQQPSSGFARRRQEREEKEIIIYISAAKFEQTLYL